MTSPFHSLPVPKPDPIFALTAEAQKAGPGAINGTIGVFMDEDARVAIFPSVAKAVKEVASELPGERFPYPPLLGLPEFRSSVCKLIVGSRPLLTPAIATTAGTGAIAVNLRLLKMLISTLDIYLPTPAWANHPPPCIDAGLTVVEVPYLVDGRASIDALVETIKKRKGKGSFGVLLQVACHNPTGLDYSREDWRSLAAFLAKQPCVALLDFAYQGFKDEPETETERILDFVDAGVTSLVSWSAAKNHSIYSLRAGLACAIVPDQQAQVAVEGTYSMITRRLHSAAATLGQKVVARVQEKFQVEWRADLRHARAVMQEKRRLMLEGLPEKFQSSLRGYGMFAMLPLTEAQVVRLKQDKVYLTLDGRVNIAGIPLQRMAEFCEKVRGVSM